MSRTKSGFTLVELLIVIVVIAILAAISVVAYNGVQERARNSKRVSDIAQIKKALLVYDSLHGGVVRPGVSGYTKPAGEPGFGGWDSSSSAAWLAFLRPGNGNMPVDPVNTWDSASTPFTADSRLYNYYCYNAGHGSAYPDSAAVQLRYRRDNGAQVVEKFAVTSCLTSIP